MSHPNSPLQPTLRLPHRPPRAVRPSRIRGLTVILFGLTCAGALRAQSGPAAAALAHYDLRGTPEWRIELPADLSEISGLALTPDGALLAHGDERALVWRFDLTTRRPVGRFGLAGHAGVLHGDFEDIAVVGDRLFLVTSAGVVVEGRVAADGRTVPAVRRTPDLRGACEIEGLTWDAPTRSLLLLCKTTRNKRWQGHVVVLAVSVDTWRFEEAPRLLVSEKRLAAVTGEKRFHGSALTWHPRTGTLLLLAGPQRTYAELSRTGEVLGGGRLDKRHRQPEGIAVTPDLSLLISDEAAGGIATITAYAFRP
jgi:uncharacterized protein YjiK